MKNIRGTSEYLDLKNDDFIRYEDGFNQQPNYILKAKESISRITENNPIIVWTGRLFWVAVIIMILYSIIFQFDLFRETPILIVIIIIGRLFVAIAQGTDYGQVCSPFEIRFYDDYFIIYKEKCYDIHKSVRMELNKFMYSDITECTLDDMDEKLSIGGESEIIWYNYEPDGTASKVPSRHKKITQVMDLKITFSSNIDYKSEIEIHSPLKVNVINKVQKMEN